LQSPLNERRVAFIGKLGGLTKREAMDLVRQHGGIPLDRPTAEVDLIVVGAEQILLNNPIELLGEPLRKKIDAGQAEMIDETELWQRLGLMESHANTRQLYTPAMLAELLQVPIRNIRRWHRLGLIQPVRIVHRLPYFDFQEISTARQLAGWLASGASLAMIKKQLQEMANLLPSVQRPIAQLNVIVEGKQLLLRKDEGLVEPGGQLRIDFDAIDDPDSDEPTKQQILRVGAPWFGEPSDDSVTMTLEEMFAQAESFEDLGDLQEAIDWYRIILARFGPQADVHFQLAELLYRQGETQAARERYFSAIELDPDFVEARANLGCVLAEMGQVELAIAAFTGALHKHEEYADAHYHLARALDEVGRAEQADKHWHRFIELAPESPWADEARLRLQAQ
jgi:tetratricopeptide (TPR) repeat protein